MTYLPSTSYTLTQDEKKSVYNTLFSMKVPKGYSSNFKHLVSMQDFKVSNLTSYGCHTLMQQLFPIFIRGFLPKHVRFAITRFCFSLMLCVTKLLIS